jgi:pimeloyl-ACP methyl ester carboxylesterase
MSEWSWTPEPGSGIAMRMFAANGLEFEVAEAGSGDRLALCLHGFPELNFSWRFQMPLLAELIDASGAREVLLIGHDWGAALAWAFAIGRVRPLTGLVIMNVPHPACFARELRTWKQLRKSWYMFLFQVPALPEAILGANDGAAIRRAFHGDAIDKSNFTPEVLDVYAGAARRRALTPMINWYRAAARDSFFRAERMDLPVIEVPTLMIWGEADRALDIANTRGTDRFVRDLTLRTLPNVSHWVQQEAVGPVNALLGEWITARLLNPGNAPMR